METLVITIVTIVYVACAALGSSLILQADFKRMDGVEQIVHIIMCTACLLSVWIAFPMMVINWFSR